MHRLANEIAIDHYVLGLKATTSKVVKQKAVESRWKNWGLGLGLGVIVATSVWLYLQSNPKQHVIVAPIKHDVSVPIDSQPVQVATNTTSRERNTTEKLPAEKKTAPATALTTSKLATPWHEGIEPPSRSDGLELVGPTATSPVAITPFLPIERTVASQLPEKKEIAPVASIVKPANQPAKAYELEEQPKEIQNPIDLVLNPLQETEVELPIDAAFTGEFVVFDPNGSTIYRCTIQNGQPHAWDGRGISGGTVGAGQYGFVLKSSEGKESGGYVTVIR